MPSESQKHSSFGANQSLVDELYDKFREDKNSVDPAWWDFFADYTPSDAAATAVPAPIEPKIEFLTAPAGMTTTPPVAPIPSHSPAEATPAVQPGDRKSTRLNSSH